MLYNWRVFDSGFQREVSGWKYVTLLDLYKFPYNLYDKKSSILGTVCVLGYCLFPICLFCILNVIFSSYLATVVRLLLALWALLWSVYGSYFIY